MALSDFPTLPFEEVSGTLSDLMLGAGNSTLRDAYPSKDFSLQQHWQKIQGGLQNLQQVRHKLESAPYLQLNGEVFTYLARNEEEVLILECGMYLNKWLLENELAYPEEEQKGLKIEYVLITSLQVARFLDRRFLELEGINQQKTAYVNRLRERQLFYLLKRSLPEVHPAVAYTDLCNLPSLHLQHYQLRCFCLVHFPETGQKVVLDLQDQTDQDPEWMSIKLFLADAAGIPLVWVSPQRESLATILFHIRSVLS